MTQAQAPSPDLSRRVRVVVRDRRGIEIDAFDVRAGSNLWVFLRKRGHALGAACSGVGVCGACDVSLTARDPQDSNAVTIQTQFEKDTLRRNGKSESHRLACLCRVFDDVEVRAEYW